MGKRLTWSLMAVLGAVAAASAQGPTFFNTKHRPAFVPSKPFKPAEIEQTAAKADGPQTPLPATSAPAVLPPAAAAQPTYQLPPEIMRDVQLACGEGPSGGFWGDANCCDTTGGCDALCGPYGRAWLGAEWLFWRAKGNFVPPLATLAPPGTPRPVAGTLGGPGTRLLIGNQGLNGRWQNGLRVYGGFWLNDEQTLGLEGDFIWLSQARQNLTAGSNGSEIIMRPFVNNVRPDGNGRFVAAAPFQDTQLVSFPGTLAGSVAVNSASDFLGAGGNVVRNLLCGPCGRLDALFGYRYFNLNDTLLIEENLTGLPGSNRAGTSFLVQDRFRTENHFHGGVLGLAYEQRFSRWFLGVRSSIALGVNHSIVDIDGATIVTNPDGSRQNFVGGLLAQPSNIGRYETSHFAVVPEIGLRLGAQVTQHFRIFGGYNFLFWNNVTRTGEVIDLRVNASQVPPRTSQTGALFPQYAPRTTDFHVHGLSIGAEFRY